MTKEQRSALRSLRRRAFTLVSKLDEFNDASSVLHGIGGLGIPSTENLKQAMMQFYSEGYNTTQESEDGAL